MLDKQSSNIMYAVVGFGGFLGMGEKYHPVPWSQLDYNEDDGAYVVKFTKDQLKAAPGGFPGRPHRDDGMAYRDKLTTTTRLSLIGSEQLKVREPA